jgi:hypothetical protein
MKNKKVNAAMWKDKIETAGLKSSNNVVRTSGMGK